MRALEREGLVTSTRIGKWTHYKRDEQRIAEVFGVAVEIFTNSRGIRVPSPVALVGE